MSIISNEQDVLPAIEHNHYDLFEQLVMHSRRILYKDQQITWVDGKPAKFPRGIFRAMCPAREVDGMIERVRSAIQQGAAPNWWLTGPVNVPSNLHSDIENHGFVRASEVPGMALKIPERVKSDEKNANFEVHVVKDRDALRHWNRIVCANLFNIQVEAEINAIYAMFAQAGNYAPLIKFLGAVEQSPVATAAVHFARGVAGIYYVATAEHARKKGYGTQILQAALAYAQAQGYLFSTLQATKLGEPVYRNLGFKTYCQLGRYKYPD
jgi:GNAT superfamily N-acetyltransferase